MTDSNAPPPPSAAEVRARRRGAAEARRDIAAGRTRLLLYGYRDGSTLRFLDLLREELGVEGRFVAGCVVNDAVVGRADGYNEVVVEVLETRHGRGVLNRLEERAERQPGGHR